MDWKAGVRFPAGTTDSSLLHSVRTGSGEYSRSVKLTIPLYLVPRLRMAELHFHSLIRLYGVVLDWLSTGTTLPLPYS
jgi:hypothetical protein